MGGKGCAIQLRGDMGARRAVVTFANCDHVVHCIAKLNGQKVKGEKVKVETQESFDWKRGKRRDGGKLKKVTANKKMKGSAFSGKKKMEKSKNNPMKGKGKRKKGIKK